MNALFTITSSSECRVQHHSWCKENTARPSNGTRYTKVTTTTLISTVTDYTGDRLPSDASRRPQDYQAAKLIAPCSLTGYTKSFTAWKSLHSLPVPVPSICPSPRTASGEHSQKWQTFYRGKGRGKTAPLFQPCEAGCTMSYTKGYAEGDSALPLLTVQWP